MSSVESNRRPAAEIPPPELAAAALTALLDVTADAVYIGTAAGVTMTNAAGLEQLGLRSIDDLDLSIDALHRRVDVRDAATGKPLAHAAGPFARALLGERNSLELLVRREDTGAERIVRATATPIVRDGVVIGAVSVNRDVTEQRHAEARAAESAERLRIAMATGQLGSWELDLSTGALEASPTCKGNLGADPSQPLSFEAMLELIHPDDRERVRGAMRHAIEHHVDYAEEYRIGAGDGVRWVAVSGRVLDDRGGAPARMVGVTQDTTTRRASEELMRKARDAAEAANRAKSEFLAVMSHELRTPLNAISGYVELIDLGLRGPVTDAQRADLARIQKSQRHLLGLINEVLMSARLEAGGVPYQFANVDVAEAIATCEALVAPQAQAKGVELIVAGCPSGATVYADPDKLRQILINLLGNAVKFTDAGGRIEVSCEPASENRLAISVADTGRGIPKEKLQSIFEPFVQLDGGSRRAHDGIGLGLAISRELAQGMEGDVGAVSELGQGSTFTVTLPRGKSATT